MAETGDGGRREMPELALNARLSVIERNAKRLCTDIVDEAQRLRSQRDEMALATKREAATLAEKENALNVKNAEAVAAVESERASLHAERGALADSAAQQAAIVTLDVGGTLFKTSRSTLCKYSGSFLEAMFGGRHAVEPGSDGAFFIDREGALFRHVLGWLRTGALPKLDASMSDQLALEADFFGLTPLARSLRAPPVDTLGALGEELRTMRSVEAETRAKLAAEAEAAGVARHACLVLASSRSLRTRA